MLLQGEGDTLLYVLGLIIAIIIIALVIYIVTAIIESKHKASDKVIMIFLLAIIIVILLPILLNAIGTVLDAIGSPIAEIRDTPNYLMQLVIIFGFLLILVCTKYLIDLDWSSALWISLLAIFILYIIFTLVPELYTFIWSFFGTPPI